MNRKLRRIIEKQKGNKANREDQFKRQQVSGGYIIRNGSTLLTPEERDKLELRQLSILTSIKAGHFSEDNEEDLADWLNCMIFASEGNEPDIYELCRQVRIELVHFQERYKKYDKWVPTKPMVSLLEAFNMAVFGDGGYLARCSRSRLAHAMDRVYDFKRRCLASRMETWRRFSLLEWVRNTTRKAKQRGFHVLGVRTERRFYDVWRGRELESI